ncbi:myrosinase 1-like [Cylas formicarius]|uniref:myrosinase 1-like n=1 Tax=Cylas formicarius TaxID=197179 RepID=UPI002958B6B4|nr:myrosinase 1-like [Cylas formicarius]
MLTLRVFLLCLTFNWCHGADLSNKFFPKNFQFGLSTSAYQIEGGWNEGGKGESMWDRYFHENTSRSLDGYNGDVTCDSYHRWEEDVQILKDIGVDVYRFSIAWTRILPDGTTKHINQEGVNYYLNLIKALRDNNIEPLPTLYHWDLPQHLSELGGWLNPQIATYFGDYARICYQMFGEHVKRWLTINEPKSTCLIGYGSINNAPGLELIGDGIYQCAYVQLLAHAKAYRIYDEEFRNSQGGVVSIALDHPWSEPYSDSPLDVEAANIENQFGLGWYAHPIYHGNWPQPMIERIGNRSLLEGYTFSRLPVLSNEDVEYIKGTHDYFAINIYTGYYTQHIDDYGVGEPSYWLDKGNNVFSDPSWPKSSSDWLTSYPEAMRKLLNWIKVEYNPAEVMVTENGWPDSTGTLEDQERITYMQGYLSNLLDAIDDGVNVIGYLHWSLLDVLEWNAGHTQRLGLVHVDFESANLTRTWKNSAYWYQNLLTTRCLVDNCQ